MKKILSLLLILCAIATCAIGCESQEEYEARVINAVENKVDVLMAENDAYSQVTNKEWSYSKTEDGQEIVTMTGTITYIISATIVFRFYVDTNNGYITKMSYTFGDDTKTVDVPKSDNSKLDL
nr:MAG TPA: protein of unknown function (DUF5016) [Caudoviricetes sp.]